MSQLTIYKTNITPDRNAKVEQIQDYLATCTQSIHSPKFQYQKIALDMVVKVAMPQEQRFDLGNYVDIFQDNRHWYFFIMGSEWISKRCVQLALSLDTINTFQELTFSDRTQVFREHKDRFRSYGDGTNYLRTIWPISEDISIPLYTDGNAFSLQDEACPENMDWFLMYRTREGLTPENIANPVECLCFANSRILYKKGYSKQPEQLIEPANLQPGNWYYFDPANNPNGKIEFRYPSVSDIILDDKHIFKFRKNPENNLIETYYMEYQLNGDSYTFVKDGPHFINIKKLYFVQSESLGITAADMRNYTDIKLINTRRDMVAGTKNDLKINSIMDVDRTDSKIMKIIRLPYAPVEVERNSEGEYIFPDEWEYHNGFMRLKPNRLGTAFFHQHFAEYDIDELKYQPMFRLSPESRPNEALESKLYHSDYYSIKAVYDSFAKNIQLENFDLSEIDTSSSNPAYVPYLVFDFKPTNTMNSKFAFRWWMSDPTDYYRLPTVFNADYDMYLLTSRNNEETIFSNDYVNYIRNGYQYDLKQHDWAMKQQAANVAVQFLSTVASFGFGAAVSGAKAAAHIGNAAALARGVSAAQHRVNTINAREAAGEVLSKGNQRMRDLMAGNINRGNQAILSENVAMAGSNIIPFAQGISTATGFIQSGINMRFSELQFQNQMAQKQAMLSSQATSTAGTDDIDLLRFYNKNKLQIIKYKPRWQDRNKLYKLFFYYGYKTDETKKPDTFTRWWFNYLQCDAHFVEEEQPLYAEFITDIKTRYQQGVTIFHNENGVYNFEQNKENLEVILVDE